MITRPTLWPTSKMRWCRYWRRLLKPKALSEELVTLVLFDDDLDNSTKDKMVINMKEKEGKETPLKRATIDMKLIPEKTSVNFATQNSRLLLDNLRLPDDFLEYPAAKKFHQHIACH